MMEVPPKFAVRPPVNPDSRYNLDFRHRIPWIGIECPRQDPLEVEQVSGEWGAIAPGHSGGSDGC